MVNKCRRPSRVLCSCLCRVGGTGIFSHLMTNKVILYGRHHDCWLGMRVVDMMPETLQVDATKSNMDGPRLWSQGPGFQTCRIHDRLIEGILWEHKWSSCEDGKRDGR